MPFVTAPYSGQTVRIQNRLPLSFILEVPNRVYKNEFSKLDNPFNSQMMPLKVIVLLMKWLSRYYPLTPHDVLLLHGGLKEVRSESAPY